MPKPVVFEVGKEQYQLPQASVLKIIRFWEYCAEASSRTDGTDGTIMYRGRRVRVIDVRRHAGVEQADPDYDTRIILLERRAGLVGLLVDRVITGEERGVATRYNQSAG